MADGDAGGAGGAQPPEPALTTDEVAAKLAEVALAHGITEFIVMLHRVTDGKMQYSAGAACASPFAGRGLLELGTPIVKKLIADQLTERQRVIRPT